MSKEENPMMRHDVSSEFDDTDGCYMTYIERDYCADGWVVECNRVVSRINELSKTKSAEDVLNQIIKELS